MKDISWTACLRLGATAAAVCLIFAGQRILSALCQALWPLLLGGGLAFVINIPLAAMERRFFPRGGKIGRAVCLTVSLAGTVAAALWLAGAILPELMRCAAQIMGSLPGLLTGLTEHLQRIGAAAWLQSVGLPEWQDMAEHGAKLAMEESLSLLGTAADALSALTAGTANVLLALVFAACLLAGKEQLHGQMTRLLFKWRGKESLRTLEKLLAALQESFRAYVVGQCAEAMILGCLCLLGMALLRLPDALTISVMAGVLALLPLVGAPLTLGIGAVLLLPEGAGAAWTFVIFFCLLQQMESNFIGPRVVGASLGLSPVWTLMGMVAGGGLFGLAGAMLAVPLAAAAKKLLLEISPSP